MHLGLTLALGLGVIVFRFDLSGKWREESEDEGNRMKKQEPDRLSRRAEKAERDTEKKDSVLGRPKY